MNELIEQIFNNFIVPVSFLRYDGKATAYVTYQQTDIDNVLGADNGIINYVEYYDFDIYSKSNYTNIIEGVKRILTDNGFIWQPSRDSSDLYEDDTGYYHKTLSFAIERANNSIRSA